MGAGIAQALVRAGVQTQLIDRDEQALQRAVHRVTQSFASTVARARMTQAQADAALSKLSTSVYIDSLHDVDFAIEAVYENLELKKEVLRQLGHICQPRTWLASNTSTLDVDVLGQASARPAQFVGMHFLTPAHVIPLLEVVRSELTDDTTLASAQQLTLRLGKMPVQTRNAWGFIGNRLFEVYLREVDALVVGGLSPQQVDAALERFGMVMGPCRMVDMAGLDIAAQVIEQRSAQIVGGYPKAHRALTRALAQAARLGVKTGRGHYAYEGHQPLPDKDISAWCERLRHELDLPLTSHLSDEDIVRRCIEPMVLEGQKLLEEGVAYRASDIDLVWVDGYGFPASKGGPMFYGQHHLGWLESVK
jgi:3-hydroxyacyl-CoA dehydrogenase